MGNSTLSQLESKGKKGTIVAMIAGTKAQVMKHIEKIPLKLRNTVSER
jgi:hypothetical protein